MRLTIARWLIQLGGMLALKEAGDHLSSSEPVSDTKRIWWSAGTHRDRFAVRIRAAESQSHPDSSYS